MGSVPSSVTASVGGSVIPSVAVDTSPQLGPYTASTGSPRIPVVPRTAETGTYAPQPSMGGILGSGSELVQGSLGAPSVPGMNGPLFTPGMIDAHYTSTYQAANPYRAGSAPVGNGLYTLVNGYQNNAALAPQDVDPNGFRTRPGQQRTSWMRVTLPPAASPAGYAPESYVPGQQPQGVRYNRIVPYTGTSAYGSGVLNSDTFGAGQTAGGVGGSNYTPAAGPPATVSTAATATGVSGMPTWG